MFSLFRCLRSKFDLRQNSIKVQYSAKQIRIEQQMLQEIEFEWVNQFYVQGTRYHAIHSWWREPMRQLVEYWIQLNQRTLNVITILKLAAGQQFLFSFHEMSSRVLELDHRF